MLSFSQKRQLRRFATSRLMHIALLFACVAVGVSAYGRYEVAREMAQRRAAAERELASLSERRAALEAEVAYLKSERGIEAEMRRQFDIAREGEQVVIILDKPTTAETN